MRNHLKHSTFAREMIQTIETAMRPKELQALHTEMPALLEAKTEAILIHALHGWIKTLRATDGKLVPGIQQNVISPENWHCPPYDATVLALLNHCCLAPTKNGMSLGLTLKGLWFALQPTKYLEEILTEYRPEEVEHAIMILLQAHKAT